MDIQFTKKHAEESFKCYFLPLLKKKYGYRNKEKFAEEWDKYKKNLLTHNNITKKQYESWALPRSCDVTKKRKGAK